MERVYDNPGFARRQNISLAILVAVILYGGYELWRVFIAGSDDPTGAMFGVLFLGGGAYGFNVIWKDSRDAVVTFDVDFAADRGVVTLWRPFRSLVLDAKLDAFTGWRHWVKVGSRNTRIHYLLVRLPTYPHPLQFEMRSGQPVNEAFRKLAPEAVADLEANSSRAAS